MADERLELPSASSFETDALCPGRQNLIRSLGSQIVIDATPDPEAERGTLIHKAFENENPDCLGEDEDLEIYKKGQATRKALVEQWKIEFQIGAISEHSREYRLWLLWPDNLQPATSAKLDAFWVSGEYGLIDELKSLYATNLTPAERNLQGRVQAVVLANEYDLKHVRVNFNKAMYRKSDTVDYTEADLERAQDSIFAVLWETQQPAAPRHAGNHCRFCPARPHCPEAGSWSLLPSVMTTGELVDRLTLQDCKMIWQRSSVITKILDEVKKRLKALTDPELEAIGLSRHAGRALDPIKDVRGAFSRLLDDFAAEEELWQLLSMSKGDLAKMLQRKKGMSADKARLWIKTNLAQFIQEKTSEGYLEEKK